MIKFDSTPIIDFFERVYPKDTGKRLDIWLTEKLHISRKHAKRLIDDRMIQVNGRPLFIAGHKLEAGDEIHVKPVQLPKIRILFEDRDLIVISKPPHMLSVRLPKSCRPSAVDAVREYLYRKTGKFAPFVKPLHRLDSGTTGAMIFALSKKGMAITELFRNRQIKRYYVGIVKGRIECESGRIEKRLEKKRYKDGIKTVPGKGKEAITIYKAREIYPDATLLDIEVTTGRTHQIRAHLAALGHPLIGDDLYGKGGGFGRPALHAARLLFTHPVTKKLMDIRAPLPKDMKRLIDMLRGIK